MYELTKDKLKDFFENFDDVCNDREADMKSKEYKEYVKYFEDFRDKNKEIFDKIESSSSYNELVKHIKELIECLDSKYSSYKAEDEYSFSDICENRKLRLYTNGDSYGKNEVTIGNNFGPTVAWDFVKYMVDYKIRNNISQNGVWRELIENRKNLNDLIDNKKKEMRELKEQKPATEAEKNKIKLLKKELKKLESKPEQTLANIISTAFIESIPDNKLKYVNIFAGKNNCIKCESALYKGELFYFIRRLYKYNRKNNEKINNLDKRIETFRKILKKKQRDKNLKLKLKKKIKYKTYDEIISTKVKVNKLRKKINDLEIEKKKFDNILNKKFHFLSISATGEKDYHNVKIENYIDVCPEYKLEDFYSEFLDNEDKTPEDIRNQYKKNIEDTVKNNIRIRSEKQKNTGPTKANELAELTAIESKKHN